MAKRLRIELWEKDPHCHWCKRKTYIYPHIDGKLPHDDEATIDHLYSKLDPRRREGNEDCVLSCLRCNQERGTREMMEAMIFYKKNRPDVHPPTLPVSPGKVVAPQLPPFIKDLFEKKVSVRSLLIWAAILMAFLGLYGYSIVLLSLAIL